jgi:integrase
MANVSFYLKNLSSKNTDKSKRYRLYVDIIQSRKDRARYPSPFKLLASEWNSTKQEIKLISPHYKVVHDYMVEIRNEVHIRFTEHKEWQFERIISTYFNTSKHPSQNTVLIAFEEFLDSNKKLLTDQTLRRHNLIRAQLIHPEFPKYDLSFFDKLIQFYIDKERVNEHIQGILKIYKTFFNWAERRGYNPNNIFKKHKIGFGTNFNKEIITLTEQEIQSMASLDLDPSKNYIRNIFLLACYSGARMSDVLRLDASQVSDDAWEFEAFKTRRHKVPIKIPFLGWCASAKIYIDKILQERFVFAEPYINRAIKQIAKQAGIDTPMRITRMSGKNQIVTTLPKYEFISFHTGRRTFISNLVNRGVPAFVAMKITGISMIKTMLKYTNTVEDDVTRELKRML